jgi:hypothetical protein
MCLVQSPAVIWITRAPNGDWTYYAMEASNDKQMICGGSWKG